MGKIRETLREIYKTKYKTLLILPLILLILAVAQLSYQYASTGDFMKKDVDLKGGISLQINATKHIDVLGMQEDLKLKFPQADISVQELTLLGQQTDIIVKSTTEANETLMVKEIETFVGSKISYTPTMISPKFGASFFKSTFIALGFAFLLMSILVFIYFRLPVPCFAVILCAVSDIICTVAVLNLLDVRLTPGGIAALLMLVGYSVDTDILLTTRVLKRHEGEVFDRVMGAMSTGLTMSLTTMGAVVVGLIFSRADILKQIMLIIAIGMVFDIIMTWIQNVGILRWYVEEHLKKKNDSKG